MFNTAHLLETAMLVLAAYLMGCGLGHGLRVVLYLGRGTRQVETTIMPVVAQDVAEPRRVRSPAARLAATVDEPLPTPPRTIERQPVAAQKGPDWNRASGSVALAGPRGGVADNLRQIKGIGPKIESSLQALGVFHLDQIAGWTKAEVDWVDGQLALKGRIRRERWVEQARELTKVKAEA